MSTNLQPLRDEAIEALAQIVGDNYTGPEITRLFRRAGFPQIAHDGDTKWRFVAAVFQEMQTNAGSRPNPVLKVIETMCHPQGYVGNRERFDAVLDSVNRVLEFYGLRVGDDGRLRMTGERVATVRPTRTADETAFEAREFHPQVVKHGRSHFCRAAYFHAVFECCKAFDTVLQRNSGIEKSGQPLMSAALNLDGPVKLNSQESTSEKDEQQGVMYLCMGLMNAVRNPQAHEPELHWPMKREDALDVLTLISFLFRKLENAIVVVGGAGRRIEL